LKGQKPGFSEKPGFFPRTIEMILEFAAAIDPISQFNARQVISRGYYAMHHAARAVVFATMRTDVTSHAGVIKAIEGILGEAASISLREQLRARNSVEYEVYPHFDPIARARHSLDTSAAFLDQCKAHLEGRWGDVEF
jgi:uncharacterized protein (UPF0332 family)